MKTPQQIIMKTMTWARDSHNLFDYESRSCHKKKLMASNPCNIIRCDTEVDLISDFTDVSRLAPQSQILATVSQRNGIFYLSSEQSEPIWMIVRSLKTPEGSGVLLKQGDIIKLGRIVYRIKELSTGNSDSSSDQTQESEDECEIPNEHETTTCRICFGESEGSENPLISPCSCTGSVKFIHLRCLQRWLLSRVSTRSGENTCCYQWKSMDCEICKKNYPFSLDVQGKEKELFQVEKSDLPRIVIEGVDDGKGVNKAVYVVTFSESSTVKMGRGHECEVRISDISVSRCHATIHFNNGNFTIEDNNSKFGTLLQVNDPLPLLANSAIALQAGRTVIAVSLKGDENSAYENSLDRLPAHKRSL